MIAKGKEQCFDFNTFVPNMDDISPQHKAVRMPLFLDGFLGPWIFAFVSPSGSGGQLKRVNHRTECSVMSSRNMISFYLERKKRQSGFHFAQVPTLTFPFSMHPLRSSSVPW